MKNFSIMAKTMVILLHLLTSDGLMVITLYRYKFLTSFSAAFHTYMMFCVRCIPVILCEIKHF